MPSKIWAFLAAIGGILLGVLKVFSLGQKSAENKIKAQQEEAAREYENAGSEAMISGLEKERKAKDDKVDTAKRDHFS
ncbi:hypothetical protein [Neptunomonas sp.]|uniref:hypothetical protein n=1 Tax=Neptunomonas sp. TaxID=1971898 RepID=UPI0035657925